MIDILQNAGLLRLPSEDSPPPPPPWFVQVMHAFSGWLASIFFLLMLGMTFGRLFDSAGAMFLLGGLLVAAAFWLLRNSENVLFVGHMGLSLSLAGQALVTLGLFRWLGGSPHHPLPWLGLALVEALLIIGIPHYLHRIVSSAVFALAIFYGAYTLEAGAAGVALVLSAALWLWLHEWDDPQYIFARQAIGYGLSVMLLWHAGVGYVYDTFWLDRSHPNLALLNRPWVIGLLSGLVFLWAMDALTRALHPSLTVRRRFAVLAPIALLAILAIWIPGLIPPVALLIVGFAHSNLTLQGLSFAGLLWVAGRFYYQLHTTLLVKSGLLILMGIVLLVLYGLFRHTLHRSEEFHAD